MNFPLAIPPLETATPIDTVTDKDGKVHEIHATIKNAAWEQWGSSPLIIGLIYGDVKGRFPDGKAIHTSKVLDEIAPGVYRTRNSVYRVEFAPKYQRDTGDETTAA